MSDSMHSTWPIAGHGWAVAQLDRAVREDRLSHAYLVTGPAQIGKATLARALAMAINCTGHPRPCGQCRACVRIASNTHADVRVVAPDGDRLKIGQMRELQRELALSPVEARSRVAILDGVERATLEAMNALLKTLEEPASNVVLILIAPETELLLPTIVSRCQVIALRPLPIEQVRQVLHTRWNVDATQAEMLAYLSGGRVGWAVNATHDKTILEARATRLEDLKRLLGASRVERFAYAETLARNAGQARETIDLWRTWWRDVMLVAAGSQVRLTNVDQREAIASMAERIDTERARQAAEACSRALWQLDKNAAARLVIDVMLLSLPRA